jgi:hypothetical protein
VEQPYIETETVNALVSSGRISSLRYNVDDPTTVAVHTQTGEILAARLHKDKSQAYKITGELPFPVHFDKTREQQERLSYDTINWVSIEDGKSERLMSGGSSLRRVVHPTKTPEPVAGPRRDIQRRMEQTGTATKADLMALAKDVGDHLKLSNVCYDVVGQDVAFQLGEYPLNYIALPVGVTIDKKVKSGNCK